MTGNPRKPAAFAIDPEPEAKVSPSAKTAARKPRAVKDQALVSMTALEDDPFLGLDGEADTPPLVVPVRRGFTLRGLLFGTLGLLVSLAIGLWVDQLIRDLFARADWLGWTAAALTGLAALALLAIMAKELLALRRLASVARLHARAADAMVHSDTRAARGVTEELSALLAHRPETATGRALLAEQRDEIIDGPDLLALAERELLAPLDLQARKLVLDAAKRVSVVTAVSPRALVDVGYVMFEASRLIRRISLLYGGRPGTLGFFRLARSVIAHLAVTGTLAASDSLVSQLLGHGLASRLSARLGEGVVNGLMTARIGIAAMETARPLPFNALKKPGMGDFLATLVRITAKSETPRPPVAP